MKFLYCPKCKELRPKAWFAIADNCMYCREGARVIIINPTWMTVVKYGLWVAVLALIAIHLQTDDGSYLTLSIIALAVSMVVAYIELVRAERKARARIRKTEGDREVFERRRWA